MRLPSLCMTTLHSRKEFHFHCLFYGKIVNRLLRTGYLRLTGKAVHSGGGLFKGEVTPFQEEGDIDEAHEDGDFDQRAYYGGEGRARVDPEGCDGHGYRELEVVRGGCESDRRCPWGVGPNISSHPEVHQEHD